MGCGNCIVACPLSNTESPIFQEGGEIMRLEGGVSKIVVKNVNCWENPDIPEDCDKCTLLCPTGAIKILEKNEEKKKHDRRSNN